MTDLKNLVQVQLTKRVQLLQYSCMFFVQVYKYFGVVGTWPHFLDTDLKQLTFIALWSSLRVINYKFRWQNGFLMFLKTAGLFHIKNWFFHLKQYYNICPDMKNFTFHIFL